MYILKGMQNIAFQSLADHFLVALSDLNDASFTGSIVYICEHDEHGALGVIINRPSDLSIHDILEELAITGRLKPHHSPVLLGGPVEANRGFILHQGNADDWQSSLQVKQGLCFTASMDILQAISDGQISQDYLITLGYAGWEAGQLEAEISTNAWLVTPGDHSILFDTPFEHRAAIAANSLGVNLHLISQPGNA